jgi:hypothetical protein
MAESGTTKSWGVAGMPLGFAAIALIPAFNGLVGL